ncbi:MAG: helix-turn-helix transcriptional regulator [Desulfobacterales bacterium]|nr:helix-turn-helix transcriptional regulator [Desulfobacterales bacterium]MDD4071297.1 helix-turn-helix transcriptional regulator [Desulfobacterales bacterium]MDD4393310.1 helix-turn-helix transcriptional regulator [Desulfobacterales bacterium]
MKQISINKYEFKKLLGRNIKKLRMKAGLSQVELGKKIGFKSSGTVSQIERGAIGLNVENIYRASHILGVHPIALCSPFEISDDQVEIYRNIMTIFSEPTDPHIIETVKTVLELAVNNISLKKIAGKIREIEGMDINVEDLIDSILKSKKT